MLPDKDSKSVLSQNWTADVLQGQGQLYTVYPSVIKHSVTYKEQQWQISAKWRSYNKWFVNCNIELLSSVNSYLIQQ
jgi:hypothetical protein